MKKLAAKALRPSCWCGRVSSVRVSGSICDPFRSSMPKNSICPEFNSSLSPTVCQLLSCGSIKPFCPAVLIFAEEVASCDVATFRSDFGTSTCKKFPSHTKFLRPDSGVSVKSLRPSCWCGRVSSVRVSGSICDPFRSSMPKNSICPEFNSSLLPTFCCGETGLAFQRGWNCMAVSARPNCAVRRRKERQPTLSRLVEALRQGGRESAVDCDETQVQSTELQTQTKEVAQGAHPFPCSVLYCYAQFVCLQGVESVQSM